MQASELPFDVVPSSLFSPRLSPLVRPLDPVLTRLFFRKRILQSIPRPERDDLNAFGFAAEMLRNLDIRYHVPEKDLAGIPSAGPVLVVANHPFGFLEGL